MSSLASVAPALAPFLHRPELFGAALNTRAHHISLIGPVFGSSGLFIPVSSVSLAQAMLWMHLVGAPPSQEHTQGTGAVVYVVGHAQTKILVEESLQLKGYYSGLIHQLCTTPREWPNFLNCSLINLK